MKTCTKCGETKDYSEFWKASGPNSNPDGYRARCKVCLGQENKKWQQEHREESRGYTERWRQANPEKVTAYRHAHPEIWRKATREWRIKNLEYARATSRQWFYDHRELFYERSKQYRIDHPEWTRRMARENYIRHRDARLATGRAYAQRPEIKRKNTEYGRIWRDANRERIRVKNRSWRADNKDRVADMSSKRRVRLKTGHVEPVNRKKVISRDRGRCWMCNRRLKPQEVTLDHLIPVLVGGPHAEWNLKVACRPCNSRRGAGRIPAQPMLPL